MTTNHFLDLQWQDSEIETETEKVIGWTGSENPWPPGQNIFEDTTISPIPDEIPASSDVVPTFSPHSSSQDVALKSAVTFEILQSPTPVTDSHHPLLDQTVNTYGMDTGQDEGNVQDMSTGGIDPTDDFIDESQVQKRKLRPQTSRTGFMSTWIDHDETGNYDPNEELRRRRARIWRRRPRVHTEIDENVSPASKENVDEMKTALISISNDLAVKLHFASDAGKSAFRDHVKRLSAVPRQEPQDFARGQRLRDCGRDSFTHQDAAAPRKEHIIQRIRYDRDYKKDPLPRKAPTNTSRECYTCRSEGKVCSLHFGHAVEDCAECKRTSNKSVPEKAGQNSALPDQQSTKPRGVAAPKKRKAVGKPAEDHAAVKHQKDGATRDPRHTTNGATKKIVSRFSHPIQFNAEDPTGSMPCAFCEQTSFQVIGLEAKEYDVIEWQDGRGYDEIGGGHRGDGVEPTRVCTACTMRRLLIIICESHKMRLIPGLSLETIDVEGAISSLFSGALRQQDRWCSVCPSLASYECEAASSVDLLGHECQGCGLSLCETCMVNLADKHKGDLQQMLTDLKDEPSDERPLGLRADWDLLKQDGLLMRYVLWANA
ncbi:hypothetical protein KC332_g14336 [Hortaea werneckii]|nr:hypothetical protein KC358_g14537 [Hortaea werneckii]KAI6812170.1 hypothetical protein KC350_g11978 [Hortaea werneckii]KAI6905390.1 hypothetical protein KC348_g14978 [Hortaea werneckii]KAI6930500.1 hypothetical protein KC341_g10188 [Hortaea werneckii]KAI6957402.1 hypothetical protein KC321_g14607 [Hortaea werneckii]